MEEIESAEAKALKKIKEMQKVKPSELARQPEQERKEAKKAEDEGGRKDLSCPTSGVQLKRTLKGLKKDLPSVLALLTIIPVNQVSSPLLCCST